VPPLNRIRNVLQLGAEVQSKLIDNCGGAEWGKRGEIVEDVF
jgi:hypothetical protein